MKIKGDHPMNVFFIWPMTKERTHENAALHDEDAYYERHANDVQFKAPAWVGSLWRRLRMTVGRRTVVPAAASRSSAAQGTDCGCRTA
jgi:hypothetical protein